MSAQTMTQTEYEAVIGLEVHAQLQTASKIFCGCSTKFGAEPNTQTCPICLGMPGVLPVLNKRVVEMAIAVGLATHCRIAPYSRFARKNYFYPDLPKGYQISQYELPLCEQGYLEMAVNGEIRRIGLTRVHMEEDAGKNLHEGLVDASHVDLNRAGVPLLEIVSEPQIRSAEEAVAYLKTLRDILVYLGVCDGNMEEGSFRCEPNVSLRPVGQKIFGIRVELKNINSFRFVQKAIEYEIKRQEKILREGGTVAQETRLWNVDKEITVTMRGKEEAHDYRYFPEPDLVPLMIPKEWIEEIRAKLPELPDVKRERFVREYGIPPYDAEVLTNSRALADYYEQAVQLLPSQPKTISNWIMTELLRKIKEEAKEIHKAGQPEAEIERETYWTKIVPPRNLVRLLQLIDEGKISAPIAKQVLDEMWSTTPSDPDTIIAKRGLTQVSDETTLLTLIDQVIADYPDEVQAYRQGKDKLIGFFVGQVMKASGGKAHPGKVNELLKKKLRVES